MREAVALKRKQSEHVVWKLPTRTDHLDFECLGCGAKIALELPISMLDAPVLMEAFRKRHRTCWKTKRWWFLQMTPSREALLDWENEGGR